MVLRTRLRCAPRILGPPRLMRRDSRVSGIQALGGAVEGTGCLAQVGTGVLAVGVVENSVGLSCVVFAGGVGVSPSLFAFRPRRAILVHHCSLSRLFTFSFSGPRLRRTIHVHTRHHSHPHIFSHARVSCSRVSCFSRPSGVALARRPLLRWGCMPPTVPLRVSPASRSRAPPTLSAVAVRPRPCFFTARRRRAATTTPRWPCLLCRTDEC